MSGGVAGAVPVGQSQQWPRWAPPTAAAVSGVLGAAVGIGAFAEQRHLAGLPGTAVPGAVLLLSGVATWNGRSGVDGAIGLAEPISFAGYRVALIVAAISYQLRTRPIRTAEAPCPVPCPATA